MSQRIVEIKVLLSSPGNLKEERKTFLDVINDANHYIKKVMDLRLLPINWEKDTFPSHGIDSQSVINAQLPVCDFYVGIIGEKVGTNTPRFVSGTIEEFENFYSKYKDDEKKKILFYFKRIRKDIDEIDPKSISKRLEFRDKLKTDGVYYWEYNNLSEFRRLLCFHLFCHAVEIQSVSNIPKNHNIDFIRQSIEEGNRLLFLLNDCFAILAEQLNNKTIEFEKDERGLRGAVKLKNYSLSNQYIKNFPKKLNDMNIKINFFVEMFNILYADCIDNFTKGILGFKLTDQLSSITTVPFKKSEV